MCYANQKSAGDTQLPDIFLARFYCFNFNFGHRWFYYNAGFIFERQCECGVKR